MKPWIVAMIGFGITIAVLCFMEVVLFWLNNYNNDDLKKIQKRTTIMKVLGLVICGLIILYCLLIPLWTHIEYENVNHVLKMMYN